MPPGKTSEVFAVITGKMDEAVDVMTGKPVYGEPIDEKYEGNEQWYMRWEEAR